MPLLSLRSSSLSFIFFLFLHLVFFIPFAALALSSKHPPLLFSSTTTTTRFLFFNFFLPSASSLFLLSSPNIIRSLFLSFASIAAPLLWNDGLNSFVGLPRVSVSLLAEIRQTDAQQQQQQQRPPPTLTPDRRTMAAIQMQTRRIFFAMTVFFVFSFSRLFIHIAFV